MRSPGSRLAILPAFLMCGALALDGQNLQIIARHTAVFTKPPKLVPTTNAVDGPILGNGDVGVAMGGPPENQQFFLGKNDLWSESLGSYVTVGGVAIDIAELAGSSYRQEQDLSAAEVVGTFERAGVSVSMRSFVAADRNLLVTRLTAKAPRPVEVIVHAWPGEKKAATADPGPPGTKDRLVVGKALSGQSYAAGLIDDVRIYDRALTAQEIEALRDRKDLTPGPVRHLTFDRQEQPDIAASLAPGLAGDALKLDGQKSSAEFPVPLLGRAFTVSTFIRPDRVDDRVQAWLSLESRGRQVVLSVAGYLRFSVRGDSSRTVVKVPAGKWSHVAGTFDGITAKVYLNGVDLYPPPGTSGFGGGVIWSMRHASPAGYSHVRSAAAATRVIGAAGSADADGLRFLLEPGREVYVATAVMSDVDSKDYLAAAKKAVSSVDAGVLPGILASHQRWWSDFWGKSSIEIPDKLIEQFWYGAQYLLASCSRGGKVAPGLFGNWITTDRPAWSSDFHLNYNHEAPFWGLYSSNHIEQAASYEQPILDMLPEARRSARELLNSRGAYFKVGTGPWGLPSAAGENFWGQKSNGAYATVDMLMRFYSTYDLDYARKVAYPFCKEVGEFWEDYLQLEGGRYVIYNDAIHEGRNPDDMNPILSLGLLRTLFQGLIDMSGQLGVDAANRGRWADIRDRLSQFPTMERNGKTVFRLTEKGYDWSGGNTLAIQHIFPAGAIGLSSDAGLLEVSRNTIDAKAAWDDGNGFSNFYTAAVRVGYEPQTILRQLADQCRRRGFPNLYIFHAGGGIENCGGIISAVDEMLLQSHEGVIRLFPVWPKEEPARFGKLRAYGAFLVSSELRDGAVRAVAILSEKGRQCTIQNPWPGRQPVVSASGGEAATIRWNGDRFTFETRAGESYEIRAR